jgi:hypothetical protein
MIAKRRPCLYCGEPITPRQVDHKYCCESHRLAHRTEIRREAMAFWLKHHQDEEPEKILAMNTRQG